MFQFLFIILLNLLCTAPVIWSLTALVGGAALHNSRLQHSLQQLVSAVTLASVSSVTDVPSLGAWPLSLRQPEAQLTGPGRWSTSMWNSKRFSLKHLNFGQINHRAISLRVCTLYMKNPLHFPMIERLIYWPLIEIHHQGIQKFLSPSAFSNSFILWETYEECRQTVTNQTEDKQINVTLITRLVSLFIWMNLF